MTSSEFFISVKSLFNPEPSPLPNTILNRDKAMLVLDKIESLRYPHIKADSLDVQKEKIEEAVKMWNNTALLLRYIYSWAKKNNEKEVQKRIFSFDSRYISIRIVHRNFNTVAENKIEDEVLRHYIV